MSEIVGQITYSFQST